MRSLITMLVVAFIAAPAMAKSNAKTKKPATPVPSAFTGKLLSYGQLMALPKTKRLAYLRNVADLLITMESFNNKYTVAELESFRQFREQVAQLMQMMSLMPEAHAQEEDGAVGGEPGGSEVQAGGAPSDPEAQAGEAPKPEAQAGAAPATCEPAYVTCKNLSPAERETAIARFRATADYKGLNANVCIAGGFASKYRTAKKLPSTCEIPRSLDLGGGRSTLPCGADEALCSPALFCLGAKQPGGKFTVSSFCVKKEGERVNRAITNSCAVKYSKMIRNQIPLDCRINPKLKGSKKKRAQEQCAAEKKLKVEACDPKYMPENMQFRKLWEELTAKAKELRDVWCGNHDFAALFCDECRVVNDKIYAINADATGTGCPAPEAEKKPGDSPGQSTPAIVPPPTAQ